MLGINRNLPTTGRFEVLQELNASCSFLELRIFFVSPFIPFTLVIYPFLFSTVQIVPPEARLPSAEMRRSGYTPFQTLHNWIKKKHIFSPSSTANTKLAWLHVMFSIAEFVIMLEWERVAQLCRESEGYGVSPMTAGE